MAQCRDELSGMAPIFVPLSMHYEPMTDTRLVIVQNAKSIGDKSGVVGSANVSAKMVVNVARRSVWFQAHSATRAFIMPRFQRPHNICSDYTVVLISNGGW